ncbi:MAG: DUF484 family protein [Rickettsiales bacterium]|nr:DUF484 family protein [Rickettsiales bacterium]
MSAKSTTKHSLSEADIRAYLKAHPEFLKANPDIMHDIAPPTRDLGDGVIDFQQFMVKNLQSTSRDLQSKYDLLVEYCRDNLSSQQQVHEAALKLVRARNIEQLLEIIALDLVSLFNVDVVRLAMESDIQVDTSYGESDFSGIVFIAPGTCDAALGKGKRVKLVADCAKQAPAGFDEFFADCDTMIASCALLKLDLDSIDRQVMLAFGVRHKDRFHPGQGIELLNFLAQVVAYQLDRYLDEMTV